jgi:hypothetical protein
LQRFGEVLDADVGRAFQVGDGAGHALDPGGLAGQLARGQGGHCHLQVEAVHQRAGDARGGQRIRKRRLQLNLSQGVLGRCPGVGMVTIQRWESGGSKPAARLRFAAIVRRIADAAGAAANMEC